MNISNNVVRAIALLGDTHNGSRYAIWPRKFKTIQGNDLVLNRAQEQMNEYWEDMIITCKKYQIDTVMHFGDHIEGNNRKEYGNFTITTSLEEQKEANVALMEPLVSGRTYFSFTGSGYHHSLDTDCTEHIFEKLSGKIKGGKNLGPVANIQLIGTKRTLHGSHGEGGAMLYRTMIQDREGLYHLAAQAEGKIPKADIIVHAHLHNFSHIHMRNQHLVGLPAWKLFTPDRIHMKMYPKMQSDIGWVLLLINDMDKITVWDYKYPAPKISDALMRG